MDLFIPYGPFGDHEWPLWTYFDVNDIICQLIQLKFSLRQYQLVAGPASCYAFNFNFPAINFPIMLSNIPGVPAFDVNILYLRYDRAGSFFDDFIERHMTLAQKSFDLEYNIWNLH